MVSKNNEEFELEEFVPYIVSTLSRQFATLLEKSLKEKGLSISNWRVLLCLSKYEKRTLNEIVDYTLLPQSTLSRSLNRMEERGLISRTRRRNDHRTYDIEITKVGQATLEDTVQDVKKMCDEPLTILEPDERENWLSTTNKIINHFGEK